MNDTFLIDLIDVILIVMPALFCMYLISCGKIKKHKYLTVMGIFILSIPLYFSTNFYGYLRFKSYCSNEGGLRVYEPLEKNIGWFAKDKYHARQAAALDNVGFVRYRDQEDFNDYDIRYLGGDPQYDYAFEKVSADLSKTLNYEWHFVEYEKIYGEVRLYRFGYEVSDIKTKKIAARFYMFSYSELEPSHTIFGAPSSVSCFHDGGETTNSLPRSFEEIIAAFKN